MRLFNSRQRTKGKKQTPQEKMAATDDGECMQYMHEQQKTPLHKLLLLRKGTGKMAFTSNKLDVLEPTGDVFQLLFKVYCNAAVKSHTNDRRSRHTIHVRPVWSFTVRTGEEPQLCQQCGSMCSNMCGSAYVPFALPPSTSSRCARWLHSSAFRQGYHSRGPVLTSASFGLS
jgi:hypothetical protein